MGHVVSKTRSPGQIFGNSCLHSRGQICDPILMKLDQNVLAISRPSSNMDAPIPGSASKHFV